MNKYQTTLEARKGRFGERHRGLAVGDKVFWPRESEREWYVYGFVGGRGFLDIRAVLVRWVRGEMRLVDVRAKSVESAEKREQLQLAV
jgi:hypothetical protein